MGIHDSVQRNDKDKSSEVKEKEFYQTPIKAVEILYHHLEEKFYIENRLFLDPCCGKKAIAGVFEKKGHNVEKFDKFPEDGIKQQDFLTYEPFAKYDFTIMNPPFKKKKEFILKALSLSDDVFCFLPLQVGNFIDITEKFLDTPIFKGKIVIYPKMILNETQDYKQGGMTAYAWFHFTNDSAGTLEKYEYYYDMRKFK